MNRFYWITLILIFNAQLVWAQFEQESKSIPKPDLSVSSEEMDRLKSAVKRNSEKLIIDAASKILAKDSKNLHALNALGVFYLNNYKTGMAKIIFNRALKDHPDERALHNNLALVYMAEKDLRSALSSFRRSIKSSRYQLGTLNLSTILIRHYDFRRALAPLEDAYDEIKSDLRRGRGKAVDIANNYAVALMGTGEGKKAKRIFDRIIDSGSRDPDVYLNYAVLLVDLLGEKKDGQRILSKLQFMTEDKKILRLVKELEKRAQ
jgi:Flp pilus assembly protein TadD